MKVDILETHDRLLHLIRKQSDIVSQGADDCLKKNPLSLALQERSPYVYIFGHTRTVGLDEKLKLYNSGKYLNFSDIPDKRILWSGRLTKPQAQTNSFLFRAQSKTDILEICWILPPPELWEQYEKGNVTEHETVRWSIHQFKNDKLKLEASFPEDLSAREIKIIYNEIIQEHKLKKAGLTKPKFEMI